MEKQVHLVQMKHVIHMVSDLTVQKRTELTIAVVGFCWVKLFEIPDSKSIFNLSCNSFNLEVPLVFSTRAPFLGRHVHIPTLHCCGNQLCHGRDATETMVIPQAMAVLVEEIVF